jgi:osmotically-inducible protein OsmY
MTPNRLGLLALTLCLGISGCTSVVNASREAPIEDDRGTRTFGSKIDDSLIETKVGVNIAKADPAWTRTRISSSPASTAWSCLPARRRAPTSRPRPNRPPPASSA